MAKVIAPFLIKGTIDDINFVVTADGNNYARSKREASLTSLEFNKNPIYDRIRNHGKEFGHCAKKSIIFRQLAVQFNNLAKDGSFAGRVNKLLFGILQEDTTNPLGKRTLSEGLKTSEGKSMLLFFEGNKLRALRQVLKIKEQWHQQSQTITLTDFLASEHLDWPSEATHVHLAMATSNWDCENDTFHTSYSNELILDKEAVKQTITLSTLAPVGNELYLTFLFIGFLKQESKKQKFLHRKYNTITLIGYQKPQKN
ncbi:hypothetical protein IWX84_000690 [Flavobacterium sp. CG_9.10]|uniref:hypothetical protein n=1 Tax=Flavobacterium sp. CG_9.10 TaxID=2787729 RepID=UPI0018C922CA|nr:hypothetical protein [Flavobacterium sp. CG_9.10]MBG6109829.1 hypothetical protein [Flavobacterium sp. CG_9.10]